MLDENFSKCWNKRVEDHFAQTNYSSDKLGKELIKIEETKDGANRQPKICNLINKKDFKKDWNDDITNSSYLKRDNSTTEKQVNNCVAIFKTKC